MDNKMMAVPTTFTPELVLGVPKILFSGPYEHSGRSQETSDDVAEDGRFLMVLREEGQAEQTMRINVVRREEGQAEQTMRINVVLNWFEELKARVPTEK